MESSEWKDLGNTCIFSEVVRTQSFERPGGTSILGGGGGGRGNLDLTSSLEAKFGARSGQVHQIRGRTWEALSLQVAKVGEKSQFWGQI